MSDENPPSCKYCEIPLLAQGFDENTDDLGTYIAETFTCEKCGYRLERHPVYIDMPDDDERTYKIVDDGSAG